VAGATTSRQRPCGRGGRATRGANPRPIAKGDASFAGVEHRLDLSRMVGGRALLQRTHKAPTSDCATRKRWMFSGRILNRFGAGKIKAATTPFLQMAVA